MILLVEDEVSVRSMTRSILEHYGHDVLEAGSLAEAREIWSRRYAEITVVFTDIVLPDGLGWELGRELSTKDPRLRIIYTSGNSTKEDGEAFGVYQPIFVPKPYSFQQLSDLIRG